MNSKPFAGGASRKGARRLRGSAGRMRMKKSLVKATLTDPQFWIPVVVLAIGITLLVALA